ncbi:Beta-1,3-galactosyltransferase 7 [Acorus calamus]|uniref:Hexosyltransferase n=1 Tax=Acorus calamus TaxID=4465 RepID=A0AAV9EM74_ACOCL|nr:Beta-1,3-galactosyltransferase 7 [Acorus calamus]
MRGRGNGEKKVSVKWILIFCVSSFLLGMLFTNRLWSPPETNTQMLSRRRQEQEKLQIVSEDCHTERKPGQDKDIMGEVSRTHEAIQSLDKTISTLQMELAATRSAQEMGRGWMASPGNLNSRITDLVQVLKTRRKAPAIRAGKGIVIRFMIGHSATSNSILDRAIDSEDNQHNDFLRLEHVEGYHELSAKTKTFFSTAVAKWDAEFYVKVDDDVHVNLGMLAATLSRHRSKPRTYIGCMKSGPVLAQKNVKYHEPEYWKFGEEGNKYFRHATGQIYAISKDLATYISINQPILHKYANEDVTLGAWFIGLDVEHIDERNMCCGTPPVGSASQSRRSKMCMQNVEKEMELFGALCYEGNLVWNMTDQSKFLLGSHTISPPQKQL